MNRSILSFALIASILAQSLPARAMDPADVNEQIRELQAARCHDMGGTYDYPRCYLPDQKQQGKAPSEPECDWGCQLIVGAIALAAARVAYCKANPEKC